jgi:LPS export ABC transporter protein LptC
MMPSRDPADPGSDSWRRVGRAALQLLASVCLASGAAFAAAPSELAVDDASGRETELRATGMTFVGSRDDRSELVVHSEVAIFFPDRDLADLEGVHAVVTDKDDGDSFEMTCERAKLDIATNDFRAEGRVRGSTADGQRYSAPWVEYDHASGVLRTDAPVRMVDDTGTFSSDGFRYHVSERKFQMLGNVSVEQNP